MVVAQDAGKTILSIGDHKYTEGEFWYVYNKNKHLPGFDESPADFAERFINYKLKVVGAIDLGLDTTRSFKDEYGKYSEELKADFLVDSSALKAVIDEAASHMEQMVSASHILISLSPDALPADTLKAWNEITDLRNRVVAGADFNELAETYSQDPSAKKNKGYLGYFSAFRMIYPFEKMAFETPVDQVSEVVRTAFGYHILFVHKRIPHSGKVRVAHIMKMFPRNATEAQKLACKQSLDSVYSMLTEGADFSNLANKYSDDKQTSSHGGEMNAFSLDNMVPEFAQAAFQLDNVGEFSKPVRTDYGWHIIKLLEKIPNEQVGDRKYIMSMLSRDGRDKAGQVAFLKKCMASDKCVVNEDLKNEMLGFLANDKMTADSLRIKLSAGLNKVLLTYRGEIFTLNDFLAELDKTDKVLNAMATERQLNNFLEASVLDVERAQLATNNLTYRYLSNEYYDGLLIFDLTNREIWSKVADDSLALKDYYEAHLSQFEPAPVLDGEMCRINSDNLTKKVQKAIKRDTSLNVVQILKEKGSQDEFQCLEDHFDFTSDLSPVTQGNLLPDTNPFHDASTVVWQGTLQRSDSLPFVKVKGKVMSAWQDQLEQEWVNTLRTKYQPVFNYKLIKK
jgi:peptidyl-prolyl cis-trans isomerase SurA